MTDRGQSVKAPAHQRRLGEPEQALVIPRVLSVPDQADSLSLDGITARVQASRLNSSEAAIANCRWFLEQATDDGRRRRKVCDGSWGRNASRSMNDHLI